MPLPAFPIDQTGIPQIGTGGSTFKKQVRTDFEGGYVQSRAQHTRARRKHPLKWNGMTEAQFSALETFFTTYQGGGFTLAHTNFNSRDWRFADDQIDWSFVAPGIIEATVNIEEM